MGIVLDKSNPLLLGIESWLKKKNLGYNSAIFCFRTKFQKSNPPKMGIIIGL